MSKLIDLSTRVASRAARSHTTLPDERPQELTELLASIVESSQDAIVSKDLNGIVATWNRGAEQLFGYTAAEMIGRPVSALIPLDRRDEECEILTRLARGERIEHYETVRIRKDRTPVEVSLSVSPLRNAEGRVIGASKVARDISARRRVQHQQDLLLHEMAHRVKNLFALISGMVTLSTRSAGSARELGGALQARLISLARAHDLTLRQTHATRPGNITLRVLLDTIISPHAEIGEQATARVRVSGPDVTIAGSAITSFALLLHELTTNAAKYGALSTPAGRIRVEWSAGEEELHLKWVESGGPAIAGPAKSEGFGSLLVSQTVTNQFDGRIVRNWKRQGLVVQLAARLSRLSQDS